jgi:hypothetical protein
MPVLRCWGPGLLTSQYAALDDSPGRSPTAGADGVEQGLAAAVYKAALQTIAGNLRLDDLVYAGSGYQPAAILTAVSLHECLHFTMALRQPLGVHLTDRPDRELQGRIAVRLHFTHKPVRGQFSRALFCRAAIAEVSVVRVSNDGHHFPQVRRARAKETQTEYMLKQMRSEYATLLT